MTAIVTPSGPSLAMLDELFGSNLRRVGFRLWDGTPWPDDRSRDATIVLRHPGALRQMFAAGTEKALAEAYLRDDFDIEGDIEAAFELSDLLSGRDEGWWTNLRTYFHLRRLPAMRGESESARMFGERDDRQHTVPRDRQAVSFHYDVSNDFYRLWLDERMVYSCAYFERPEMSLDEAQEAKLRHICRKLRLAPGQRLLDIGCGWGGLSLYAARHHGVTVTGVTLSREQARLATERARAAGLQDRVTIELRDYRELNPARMFDAIVSVGMSEHVGRTHLPAYFRRAAQLLRPGGVFLNHAIGDGVRQRLRAGPSFIEAYVFPDSDIPPIPIVLQAAEGAGFEVRDVENLREHYARTLRHWVSRLEAAHEDALEFVNEPTYRVWRLYMAGSAYGFAHGALAVYQALLVKPDADGVAHLPPTRHDWYPAA
ncbi:MAG TPA: cyclopropane-fatty-acyl-phospholipid synthase family protein [Opitutaceae bacterium]|nr:cyclopropane-fatty-acyl-phospholipid synthase family protein [Opitutaceae bacterium]